MSTRARGRPPVPAGGRPGARDGAHGPRARAAGRRTDGGSVTAELAVGLPAVVLVGMLLVASTAAGAAALRCDAAARAGAREAALGASDASVRAVAERVAGGEPAVGVSRADGWTTVEVSMPVSLGRWAAPVRVSGSAVAKDEP